MRIFGRELKLEKVPKPPKSPRKKMETSKKLAWWAVMVATASLITHYVLTSLGMEPSGELTGGVFGGCIGYLITYAGKSLGEKMSRNKHGLDVDGNPLRKTVEGEEHP